MVNYDIIFKVEVLREISAGILAEYLNFLSKHKISTEDTTNTYVQKYWELVKLRDDMYNVQTMAEIEDIKVTFLDANNIIKSSQKKFLFK